MSDTKLITDQFQHQVDQLCKEQGLTVLQATKLLLNNVECGTEQLQLPDDVVVALSQEIVQQNFEAFLELAK